MLYINLTTYVVLCTLVLIVTGLILFGAIRKTNPLYMIWKWLTLKVSLCCCRQRTSERVEQESKELSDLLRDIDNTTGSSLL